MALQNLSIPALRGLRNHFAERMSSISVDDQQREQYRQEIDRIDVILEERETRFPENALLVNPATGTAYRQRLDGLFAIFNQDGSLGPNIDQLPDNVIIAWQPEEEN